MDEKREYVLELAEVLYKQQKIMLLNDLEKVLDNKGYTTDNGESFAATNGAGVRMLILHLPRYCTVAKRAYITLVLRQVFLSEEKASQMTS